MDLLWYVPTWTHILPYSSNIFKSHTQLHTIHVIEIPFPGRTIYSMTSILYTAPMNSVLVHRPPIHTVLQVSQSKTFAWLAVHQLLQQTAQPHICKKKGQPGNNAKNEPKKIPALSM